MSRRESSGDDSWREADDDEFDGPEEWEDPDEADQDDDDESGAESCPHCGREVYEQAERCPHCGNYISDEERPRRRWARWVIIGIVLAMAAVGLWIVGR